MSPPRKPRVARVCKTCRGHFTVFPSVAKHGMGIYCSRRCSTVANMAKRVAKADPIGRFWSRVDSSGGPKACWLWVGTPDADGYGRFFTGGRKYRAHAFALAQRSGPAPVGKPNALHSCDVPACCNPDHLRWGSQQDNIADRVARNRSRGHGHKIDVPEMLRLRAQGWSARELMARYGVHETSIYASIARAGGCR